MDKKEKIIQIITDRVMNKLDNEEQKPVVSFIGEPKEYVKAYYQGRGYEITQDLTVETANIVVITKMSLYELTRLANITPIDELETKLLNRIMNIDPIVILEESMEYTKKKKIIPKGMLPIFEKSKNDLKKCGVQFLSKSDFLSVSAQEKSLVDTIVPYKKELISANKVQNSGLSSGDVFTITSNMIITPLAKDYLRERHIQLIERDA